MLQLLRELGYKVPSHMAQLSEEEERQLLEAVERQARGAPAVRPVRTAGASVEAAQVAKVVGKIDLQDAGEVAAAQRKPARAPRPDSPARRKKETVGRRTRDRDEEAEELAREAQREGIEMVAEREIDFIGPPLPPEGVVAEEGIRTIDLSQLGDRKVVREAPGTTAPPPRGRRRAVVNMGGRQVRTLRRRRSSGPKVSIQAGKTLECTVPITLKDLSQLFGVRAQEMIKFLIRETQDFSTNMNTVLDEALVQQLAEAFERTVVITAEKKLEEKLEEALLEADVAAGGDEAPRPPVITILGHVDHGKTSLLDKIRDAHVVDTEHGGITQHIGAFQVKTGSGQVLTFLDTPGHAAFTAMRARGASAADIVILVVAADDGVMPQTEESINHAQAARVPIVVAVNKIDRPEANSQKVKQQLAAHGLTPEDWGGDTIMCDVSAITGQGIDEMLENVAVIAEVSEFKASADMAARGTVIEARKDPHRGVICTLLVNEGTLRRGDTVLAGEGMGRVRTMTDHVGQQVKAAGPSMPVEVYGLSHVPDAGDQFSVVKNARIAKQVIEERRRAKREGGRTERPQLTLATLFGADGVEEAAELRVILKADVRGSLEPLRAEIQKLEHPEVKVNLLYAGLGAISRSDVDTAIASNAVILGFHVTTEPAAKKNAGRQGVEIRQYTVIYELIDDLRAAMEKMLAPEQKEEITGHAEIRKIFESSRLGNLAGCYVTDGVIRRNGYVRIYRDGKLIYGADRVIQLDSLRRVKDDVREVREGFECGVRISGYQAIKEGDVVEFYELTEVRRSLEGTSA